LGDYVEFDASSAVAVPDAANAAIDIAPGAGTRVLHPVIAVRARGCALAWA